MRLRIENATARPVVLELTGRAVTLSVIVTRDDAPGGAVVWRSLEGRAVEMVLMRRTLAAGGVLTAEETWDQRAEDGAPAGPGRYRVDAAVLTGGPPLLAPPRWLRIGGRGGG
jgi:hypothetical protein